MSASSESLPSEGTRITVVELKNFFLDNIDKFVLAACKRIEDDGTVVLNEGFDITKAMATEFHVFIRCNTEQDVAQAEDASTPRPGHSSAPDSSPATDRDESDGSLPKQGKALAAGKKTKAGKAIFLFSLLHNQRKVKDLSSGGAAASIPKSDRILRPSNKLSPTARSVYYKLKGKFEVGSEFSRALLVELDDRIQAAIAVKQMQEKNPDLEIEIICLSKVTKGDLEKMGVKAEWPEAKPIILDRNHVNALIDTGRHLSLDMSDERWEAKEVALLCENLRTIVTSFGSEFEARTRAIIDDFSKSLMRMIKESTSVEDAAILLEITLGIRPKSQDSSSGDTTSDWLSKRKKDLVIFGEYATLLVGRVDYLSLIVSRFQTGAPGTPKLSAYP
ncbi:hypothetical protein H1R20_g3873, partial [Candolleomyces eurysporus]